MNFELSDEQVMLREAARGALSRHDTIAAAREAGDGAPLPDLWPLAREAGWPGLLIGEEHGGAGLEIFDAMLVAQECGRTLAPVPLIGHVPATLLLAADGEDGELLAALAGGEKRAAFVPARPPDDIDTGWTVEAPGGAARAAAPTASEDGDGVRLDGLVSWVPDAIGADVLVVAATSGDGTPVAVAIEPDGEGVAVTPAARYDHTRDLAHVELDGARGRRLAADAETIARAWYLAQALIAAESLGAVEECLERSVAYAKERFTFGRPIGSYQAVKHSLVEVLRQMENTRSLTYYAGWAGQDKPEEFALAASAARTAAGHALEYASRAQISVHGGIGATWEHDAPWFFRRAQLSRRLLGGTDDAAERVGAELLAAVRQ